MLQELFTRIARALNADGETAAAAADPPVGMDDLRVEVEMEAQRTLDQIDDALTAWQQLEQRLERERSGVALWERKSAQAAAESVTQPEGTPGRATWEALRAQAYAEAEGRRQRVKVLSDVMEQARPAVEEALRLIEAIGFSREKALSQIDRLELTQATVEAKERLAAARLSGETSRIEGLLRDATERGDAASAAEELADFIDPGKTR